MINVLKALYAKASVLFMNIFSSDISKKASNGGCSVLNDLPKIFIKICVTHPKSESGHASRSLIHKHSIFTLGPRPALMRDGFVIFRQVRNMSL